MNFHGIPGLGNLPVTETSQQNADVQMDEDHNSPAPRTTEAMNTTESVPAPADGPSITSALEAMLDEYDPMPELESTPTEATGNNILAQANAAEDANSDAMGVTQKDSPAAEADVDAPMIPEASGEESKEGEHPEWEIDSSPYESSSDDSSDSSDEDSEDEQYELLGIEETARILMKAEGGSDDEDDTSGKPSSRIRTKNEIDETYDPRPDITITPEMKIKPLGLIEHIVDNTLVIKGFTPAEYQVLDSGSIICLQNRTVVGTIAEPLGKVQQPMYLVGFQKIDEIKKLGLEPNTEIFYSVAHANYVFTQALKSLKGSDASNIHDEEVGADEMEFSDDEKEAEYKRMKKQKRREKNAALKGETVPADLSGLRNEVNPHNDSYSSALNYNDDGGYRKLTRPTSYGTQPGYEAPQVTRYGSSRGGGRGGARGGARSDCDIFNTSPRNNRYTADRDYGYSQNPRSDSYPNTPQQTSQQQSPVPAPPQQYQFLNFFPPAPNGASPASPFPAPPSPNANLASITPLPQFPNVQNTNWNAVTQQLQAMQAIQQQMQAAQPNAQQFLQAMQSFQQPLQQQQQAPVAQPSQTQAQAGQSGEQQATLAMAMANPAFMAFLTQATGFGQPGQQQ